MCDSKFIKRTETQSQHQPKTIQKNIKKALANSVGLCEQNLTSIIEQKFSKKGVNEAYQQPVECHFTISLESLLMVVSTVNCSAFEVLLSSPKAQITQESVIALAVLKVGSGLSIRKRDSKQTLEVETVKKLPFVPKNQVFLQLM